MTRVGTANLQQDMPNDDAMHGLHKVTDRADVVGVQEWVHRRDKILSNMGKLHRILPRPVRDNKRGWTWARPLFGGPPTGARAVKSRLISCHSRVLARGQRLARVKGRRTRLPATKATLTIWQRRSDQRHVAVLNFHLDPGVQDRHGVYKPGDRAARHRKEVRALEKIIAHQRRKGREVYATGDGNYDGLRLDGLTSCWIGHPHQGTLGNRAVDVICAQGCAEDVVTIRTGSDHLAAVATY